MLEELKHSLAEKDAQLEDLKRSSVETTNKFVIANGRVFEMEAQVESLKRSSLENNNQMQSNQLKQSYLISGAIVPIVNREKTSQEEIRKIIFPKIVSSPKKFVFDHARFQTQVVDHKRSWTPAQWDENTDALIRKNLDKRTGVKHRTSSVILTVVNFGMLELCLNWLASLELQGYQKFLIFSYDFESFAILTALGHELSGYYVELNNVPK